MNDDPNRPPTLHMFAEGERAERIEMLRKQLGVRYCIDAVMVAVNKYLQDSRPTPDKEA